MTGPQQPDGDAGRNPWRWRPGDNPYRDTAFAVLGLDPRPRARRTVLAQIRRRVARARFGTLTVLGTPVTESDVHVAGGRLREPGERLLEELRTHRPHPVRIPADDLADRLDELRPPPAGDAVVLDRLVLARAVPRPRARQFAPLPEVSP